MSTRTGQLWFKEMEDTGMYLDFLVEIGLSFLDMRLESLESRCQSLSEHIMCIDTRFQRKP